MGRHTECEALVRLLGEARVGKNSVLVLRAQSGGGKSALLDYAAEQASGLRVARASGVESEMELTFAGAASVVWPDSRQAGALPVRQRDALRVAFGLSAGGIPERFMVGLAALGLLSEVAEEQLLVCLVDDAQWLDQSSAQLAFVARRLMAEPVALVFAVREPSAENTLIGLPELVLEGLDDVDARLLLSSVLRGRLDEPVRDRIVAETRGNPLALLELSRGMTPADVAGGFGLSDARPLGSRIEHSFLQRIRALRRDSQQLLLTAAAEPVGDATLLWGAAERLGIGTAAAVPAEAAGLVEVGLRVRFRHPLVRSASYQGRVLTRPPGSASGLGRGNRSGDRSRPSSVEPVPSCRRIRFSKQVWRIVWPRQSSVMGRCDSRIGPPDWHERRKMSRVSTMAVRNGSAHALRSCASVRTDTGVVVEVRVSSLEVRDVAVNARAIVAAGGLVAAVAQTLVICPQELRALVAAGLRGLHAQDIGAPAALPCLSWLAPRCDRCQWPRPARSLDPGWRRGDGREQEKCADHGEQREGLCSPAHSDRANNCCAKQGASWRCELRPRVTTRAMPLPRDTRSIVEASHGFVCPFVVMLFSCASCARAASRPFDVSCMGRVAPLRRRSHPGITLVSPPGGRAWGHSDRGRDQSCVIPTGAVPLADARSPHALAAQIPARICRHDRTLLRTRRTGGRLPQIRAHFADGNALTGRIEPS